MFNVRLGENVKQVEEGARIFDAFEHEIKSSDRYIIACRFNNEVKSLGHRIHSER